ncbi:MULTISPECIES: HdeD family acid-resistance protein [Tatumella]|uniref:HdeD family acid-resistance protein n=1 Tax=Tatumella punctata TaxID=399969 RepID=A0ABW1VN76_9GAMM|nr:HdeD family acid-resistance protein [Tatumella sp. JGM130]MBS0895479.1 HdeD family acid-resistance protein [Tatumella sp. JGM130]
MLNIDRKQLLSLNEDVVKKQRVLLLITGCLLLAGGIFCLVNPFASGVALSTLAGVMFLLSGVGLIIGMIANRSHNFGPMLGGILLGVAYLIMGYVFIRSPVAGIMAMSVILAVLFAVGGIIRLSAGFRLRGHNAGWLQIIVGILDIIIAVILLTAGPQMSFMLVTVVVGLEMLFSSFALFQIAALFRTEK